MTCDFFKKKKKEKEKKNQKYHKVKTSGEKILKSDYKSKKKVSKRGGYFEHMLRESVSPVCRIAKNYPSW